MPNKSRKRGSIRSPTFVIARDKIFHFPFAPGFGFKQVWPSQEIAAQSMSSTGNTGPSLQTLRYPWEPFITHPRQTPIPQPIVSSRLTWVGKLYLSEREAMFLSIPNGPQAKTCGDWLCRLSSRDRKSWRISPAKPRLPSSVAICKFILSFFKSP